MRLISLMTTPATPCFNHPLRLIALQAFQNVLKRMLEAAGRGMWQASPETVKQLRDQFADMDNELEGVTLRK